LISRRNISMLSSSKISAIVVEFDGTKSSSAAVPTVRRTINE